MLTRRKISRNNVRVVVIVVGKISIRVKKDRIRTLLKGKYDKERKAVGKKILIFRKLLYEFESEIIYTYKRKH